METTPTSLNWRDCMSICHRVPSSCTPVAISFNLLLPYKSYRKKVSILPSFGLRVAFIQRLGEYLFKTSFRGKGFLNVKNHVSSIVLSWLPENRLVKFKTLWKIVCWSLVARSRGGLGGSGSGCKNVWRWPRAVPVLVSGVSYIHHHMTILPYHAIQTIPSFPCIWPSVLPTIPFIPCLWPSIPCTPKVEASLPLPRMPPTLGSAPVSALSYIDHVADYMHTNQRLQDVPSLRQFPTEVPMYLPIKGWPGAKLRIKSVRIKIHFKTTSKRQTHHSDWNNFSIAGPTSDV